MSHYCLVVWLLSGVFRDPSVPDADVDLDYEDRALGDCVPWDDEIRECHAVGVDRLPVHIRKQRERNAIGLGER